MWEKLIIRHNTTANEDARILTCDAAADQCAVVKKAWHVDERTNRSAMCRGHVGDKTQKLDIASACSIAYGEGLLPMSIKANEALLIDNEEENESLSHPFQAMDCGCRLNLTPIGHTDANNEPGDPSIVVNDDKLLFQHDG